MSAKQGWRDTRVTRLLKLDAPIVQGPFGGGLSTAALAAEVSNSGGLGSFGGNVLSPSQLTDLVTDLRTRTKRSFAINVWVPQASEPTAVDSGLFSGAVTRLRPYLRAFNLADPTMPETYAQRFDDQVAALLETPPPVISFVMGVPPVNVIAAARAKGIITIGTATTVDEAIALEKAGIDIIAANGSDGGGHRGSFLRPVYESLVGTFSLIPQVADAVKIPVIAAGGIADGRGIAAAMILGAEAVQIGTAFLACEESGASRAHREAILGPRARVTVLTRAFTGRHARSILNDYIREMSAHEQDVPPYPVQNWLTQPIRRASSAANDPERISLWAGQSASLAKGGRAKDLMARLIEHTDLMFSSVNKS